MNASSRSPDGRWRLTAVLLVSLAGTAAHAGSFLGVTVCDELGCRAGRINPTQTGNEIRPFAITHPINYQRAGGPIEITICVSAAHPELILPTQRAVATWNSRTKLESNCAVPDDPVTAWREGCYQWEDSTTYAPGAVFDAESLVLHELGHCALALDHVERFADEDLDNTYTETSFSRSHGEAHVAGAMSKGPDGVPGTGDDLYLAGLGQIAESTSWHRRSDNDPFVIDSTVIDTGSYSRSVVEDGLPVGQSWSAIGHRLTGLLLGHPGTGQAAMYGAFSPMQKLLGLTADDVDMVAMGMTGEDQIAGTADDYTVHLTVVPSCDDPHLIQVSLEPITDMPAISKCANYYLDYAFSQPNPLLARHLVVRRNDAQMPLRVILDSELTWWFGAGTAFLEADGFETGDFLGWNGLSP